VTRYSNGDYTSLRLYIVRDRAYPAPKSDGIQHNLYVGGDRPSIAYSANLSVTDDGMTYHVYTTAALSAMKLGYVIRWRVVNNWGEHGQWVTPPANWTTYMPPASTGMPFWRHWLGNQSGAVSNDFNYAYNSLADWYAHMASAPTSIYSLWYAAEMAVRHVWLSNPTDGLAADELNPITVAQQTLTESRMLLRPRPPGNYAPVFNFSKTIRIILRPWGTCTTPTGAQATVHFGTLYPNNFPNNQGGVAATRDFTFTLTRCPRVPIRYYVHANNRWVDSSNSIVGMNDSNASGNPRGIGIQLRHNGGQHGTGVIPIYPHEQPVNPAPVNSYTRSYPGEGATNTSTGVTHTIPLRASLVRTSPSGTPIQPGAFKTVLVFVISYP